ncbi:hypothetical protein TNCV_4986791 [Trichonephila clavipes]|nr:hypothetical protein TNCV_4986791 [Trichonephila clavipes]
MWSVAKSSRVAEQCDVNVQSIHQVSFQRAYGSPVVKVFDHGNHVMSLRSVPLDSPSNGAMHLKSVESLNVLTLVWCGRGTCSGVVPVT